jgi:probable HAF family extracellular repeat protein
MKRCTFLVMAVLLVFVPWRQSVRADAAHYTVEDLGLVGGTLMPTITGINASGQVSGYVNGPAPGTVRAVRYSDGHGWEYLPGLDNTSFSIAFGINASGDLTGYHFTTSGTYRAFRYRDGSGVEDIAPLTGGSLTIGYAINTNGDVAGYADTPAGLVGFLAVSGGPAVALPSLGGTFTVACGVNDAGQIAGYSYVTDNLQQHAFRLDPGQASPVDIGSFDGPSGASSGCAIDGAGRVGGQAANGGVSQAFRFSNGTLLNLDTFASAGSNTESITDGTSVGWFLAPPDGSLHAMVHTDATGTSDLNTLIDDAPGWALFQAKAVNASGVIAGEGALNAKPAVFRLRPVASAPADTTPPSITALSATPSVITPPNDAMVPVAINVTAVDAVDPSPVCAISGIDTNGAPASLATVTGPLSGLVRARDRVRYTFTVRCADATGNAATRSVDVIVPADTTAPVFTSLTATPSLIAPPKGQTVSVTTVAVATDDSGVAPVCKLANITGPGSAPADFNVTGANTGTVRAVGGRTYTFNELCVDKSNNVAWSSVNVVVPADTAAPVIAGVTASPSVIWPPNDQLVGVSVTVSATDNVDDSPVCTLTSISSTATTADDYAITGPLSARLRASGGRTYTLTVRCADAAGNSSTGTTQVAVPADTSAPVISAISATPSMIWPPYGNFVPVSVSVTATDDVDAAPACVLQSITGAANTEFIVTGLLSASVRADKNSDGSNRVYALHVSCADRAGNATAAVTTVTITKDPLQGPKGPKQ